MSKGKYARKAPTRELNDKILIVYSGQTEDVYLKKLKAKYGSSLRNVSLELYNHKNGKRADPLSIVKVANEKRSLYKEVWAVFDYDNDTGFDDAVKLAERSGIYCAFSNIAIEYWFYLHFNSTTGALNCNALNAWLTTTLGHTYVKTSATVQEVCNLLFKVKIEKAEETAQRGHQWHKVNTGGCPSSWCSCTTMYMLTKKLREWSSAY